MGPEEECINCEISTARASHRKKEPHTGGTYPGEYIFLDILHPVVPVGLTRDSTFPFYLILVDPYSRYACIYGLRDKSSACVIDTLTRYQANHGHVGNYGYLDIARICADSGSQFTSDEFRDHCWQAGISLSLAAPKKQYQNHLAERSWQTISTMARSLLVHARLPDSFTFHSLTYSCKIFKVLPVKGLYIHGHVGTPFELFQGTKPCIREFRVFGCPVTARKWMTSQNGAGKQTQRGIRGIFIGFDKNQKGYLFYSPASRQIYLSGDIMFDESFNSTIATTWRLNRDSLALRPAISNLPNVTTTLEHTGAVANPEDIHVEEGDFHDDANNSPHANATPVAHEEVLPLPRDDTPYETPHGVDDTHDDCPALTSRHDDDDSVSDADSNSDLASDDD
jgi:hypothetical protein